jgi:hypothetical protein
VKDENNVIEDLKNENKESTIIKKLKKSLYLNNTQKGILDSLQEKLASRKLLVFLTATGLFIGAGLDPETWGMIAMIYIGGQSAIDIVQTWRHGRQ